MRIGADSKGCRLAAPPSSSCSAASCARTRSTFLRTHLRSTDITPDKQRDEIERGISTLEGILGQRPIGYRSPAWELTPTTLSLLKEYEFVYDSSCMGDDRPYLEENDGDTILELPVHWALDDVPYYRLPGQLGGHIGGSEGPYQTWIAEFDSASQDMRHITYTLHPEVIGRGSRLKTLETLIETIADRGAWFAPHQEIATLVVQANPGLVR